MSIYMRFRKKLEHLIFVNGGSIRKGIAATNKLHVATFYHLFLLETFKKKTRKAGQAPAVNFLLNYGEKIA